jgi:hypothetical protein
MLKPLVLAIFFTLTLVAHAATESPTLADISWIALTASIDGGEGSKAMSFSFRRMK